MDFTLHLCMFTIDRTLMFGPHTNKGRPAPCQLRCVAYFVGLFFCPILRWLSGISANVTIGSRYTFFLKKWRTPWCGLKCSYAYYSCQSYSQSKDFVSPNKILNRKSTSNSSIFEFPIQSIYIPPIFIGVMLTSRSFLTVTVRSFNYCYNWKIYQPYN